MIPLQLFRSSCENQKAIEIEKRMCRMGKELLCFTQRCLGHYELIIRFSSHKYARDGTDGRFLFYILYFKLFQNRVKFGAEYTKTMYQVLS